MVLHSTPSHVRNIDTLLTTNSFGDETHKHASFKETLSNVRLGYFYANECRNVKVGMD